VPGPTTPPRVSNGLGRTNGVNRNASEVLALDWPDFLEHMGKHWRQGEHVAVVAPTGAGKTTFSVGLLRQRKYVLAFDPKGGDSTLAGSGFERVTTWNKRLIAKRLNDNERDGKPTRLIIGKVVNTHADRAAHRQLQALALHDAWEMGGFTTYIDELQLLTDRRFMALGDTVEEYLIAARDKRLSVVSTYQRPANVPRAASDQASWFAVGYTRDSDVVDRLGEMAGRPRAEMRGAVKALPRFSFLVFSRDPREPIIVTKPEEIKRRPQK
jgi:hypothetical protein